MSGPSLVTAVRVYGSFAEAELYRADWERWTSHDPQLSWAWMSHWWREQLAEVGRRPAKLALAVVVGEHGQCLGIAPWYVGQSVSGRTLRFLGDGKAATDYVRLLGDRQQESLVAETLARWVTSADFESRYGALDLMVVDGHVGDEHRLISFWNRLVQQGWNSQAVAIESAWQTALPGDWKQLLATFSKSQRRKVNKAFRLRQEGQVTVRWVSDLAELQAVWPSFVYLHQRRRHELGQAGCFDRPEFERFLLHTTSELIERQRSRLIMVEHAGQPLGAALLLQTPDKLMMYQSGINPDQRHFEPGHLVNAFALEWANEQGFRTFDFMRGDEPYKQDWGAQPTRLWRTRLVSPRWTSRLKNSAWVATRSLKQLSQRWLYRGTVAEAGHD